MNAPLTTTTPGAPSIVTEAALMQHATGQADLGDAFDGATPDVLNLSDISDVADSPDSGIDVKTTSDFKVVFRNDEGKKIKGQGEASENICAVRFARVLAGDNSSAEGPKKRGRKSEAEKAAKVDSSKLNIMFWDDNDNISVSFLEALAEREDFTVEVQSVGDNQAAVEVFSFEGCNVVPQAQFHEFNNTEPGSPRTLSLTMSYTSLTRTNAEEAS